MQQFMTSNEVATFCGVTHDTVGVWIRKGRLPRGEKSGREYRHKFEDLCRSIIKNGLQVAPAAKMVAEKVVAEIGLEDEPTVSKQEAITFFRSIISRLRDQLPSDVPEETVNQIIVASLDAALKTSDNKTLADAAAELRKDYQ